MADGDIIGFDEQTAKRILDATTFYEHNPRYPLPVRKYGGPPGGASSGGSVIVRFRLAAPIAGTMTAICFIHAVPNGMTVDGLPGLANLEFPGNPFPGTPNILVCDPLCSFFNEPAGGLTDRLGWAAYMQPVVPNSCQPDYSYLEPQWEVFALNCVANPEC